MSSGTNKARILAASEGRVEFTQSCLRAILIAEIYLKERERERDPKSAVKLYY